MQLGEFYNTILLDFISSYTKFYSCETAFTAVDRGLEAHVS